MHSNRCSNGCKSFAPSHEGFPAGSCTIRGIKMKLTPERRDWINIVGCATMEATP